MPHDHVATKTAPTIPMIGSIQFQPNYLADKRATMARTDVRASAMTCRLAALGLWSSCITMRMATSVMVSTENEEDRAIDDKTQDGH